MSLRKKKLHLVLLRIQTIVFVVLQNPLFDYWHLTCSDVYARLPSAGKFVQYQLTAVFGGMIETRGDSVPIHSSSLGFKRLASIQHFFLQQEISLSETVFFCCSPVYLLRQFLYSKFCAFYFSSQIIHCPQSLPLCFFLGLLYLQVFLIWFISFFLPCQLLTVSSYLHQSCI